MNPVRSLAPDLIRWNFQTSWVYIAGPVLGALLGVVFEWLLKGKATSAGAMAAQGSLGISASPPIQTRPPRAGKHRKSRDRPSDHNRWSPRDESPEKN